MDLEKIFIFFGWFLLCFFIGLLIIGAVLGLLQYNIFIGLGVVIGVTSLGIAIVVMKED